MKIKINNEEVVCDKNFTVSEEMLAASSVTLNNVYPKSWEETKDYVSNFYYPKDYSICKIYDETVIPYEPGTEVSGNPLYLTDVVASKIYQYKLYGYTKQTTYSGKNILNFDDFLTTRGATYTKDNGVYSITTWNQSLYSNPYPLNLESGKTYTLSQLYQAQGTTNLRLEILKNGTVIGRSYATNNTLLTTTFTADNSVYTIRIDYSNRTNPIIFNKPQLEKGSTSSNYEPYVGGTPSPNPNYPQEVEVGVGKNLFDGLIELGNINPANGTLSASTTRTRSTNFIKVTPNTTYTLTRQISGSYRWVIGYTKNKVGITDGNYDNQASALVATTSIETTITFTTSPTTEYIKWYDTNSTDLTEKVMIEKGSIATPYLPYNTVEVKGTGKNLLSLNNYLWAYFEGTGSAITSATANYRNIVFYIKCKPNTRYTFRATTQNLQQLRRAFTSTAPGIGTTVNYSNAINLTDLAIGTKFTTYEDTEYLVLRMQTQAGYLINLDSLEDYISNAIIVEGYVDVEYEPYKETSIQYNLGDNFVADEDYIENGVLHKNIGKYVITGNEDFSHPWNAPNVYKFNNVLPSKSFSSATRNIICKSNCYTATHYDGGTGSMWNLRTNDDYPYLIAIADYPSSVVGHIYIKDARFTTSDDFRTWLQTQYNNGNPVVVYYELAEETTVDLTTEGELSLYDGINNVSADTDFTIDMLYNRVNGETIEDIIFNGLVKRTGNISLNPRHPHYCSLQVLDFKTFLSEGDVLNFVIANKTIEQAINMVVNAISSYGFVVGNIELDAKNDIIGAYSTDEKTAYDVFQYIADITNAKWFTRMIDEETIAIDFYDTDKLPNKGLIEYTDEWFCQNKIDDMSYSMDTNDYRNKQIILSDEVFGSTDYNETITATGYTTQFLTGGKIAKLNGATINSQTATIATNEEKEAGIEAEIYYTPGENQFETAETQAQGIIIEVSYTPLVKGREIVVNNEEVDRISSQLNRNGIISRYENRNDTTSSSELQQIGQSYIKYKGNPEITLKIVSRSNLYNVGDQVTFSSPLTELSTEYMVKKKSINYIATQSIIWYTFELSSNYNSESAINYFDNQRAKRAGNISESDYIIREIDIYSNCQVKWQNTTITETTITGDNVLNAPLNAPLTQ